MQYIKREKQLEDGTRICFDLQNLDELEQILTSEREKIRKGNEVDKYYKTAGGIAVGIGALLLIITLCVACKLMDDFKYGALLMYMSGIIMMIGFVFYLVSYKQVHKSPWLFEDNYRDYQLIEALKEADWDKNIAVCTDGNYIRYINLSSEYKWLYLPNSIHYWDKDYIEIRGYLNKNEHRYMCDVWEPLKTHSSIDAFTRTDAE